MIHWNRESENISDVQPEVSFLFQFGLPETYQAADLGDFYHNRHTIIPTRRPGLTGLLYNGRAFVVVGPGALHTPLSKRGGELRDITCFFPVGFTRRGKGRLPRKVEPFRMYSLILQYTINLDSVDVHNFEFHGPEGPQRVARGRFDSLLDALRPRPSFS